MSTSEVIRAESLTKAYGEFLAVDKASFTVSEGEIFGFLGLNGAGKTTTIKMLASLIAPTSGGAKIFGLDVSKHGLEIRRKLGVVQQQESYDRNLTMISSLRLYAALWGIPRDEAEKRIDSLLQRFQLQEMRNKKIRWLSFGQRRRLQVAREFMHDASLLILDEPTVGMDILARRAFLDYCKECAKRDRITIFYTTHIISEAEYLCDRVALIHKGKIIALDTPKELKQRYADVKSVSVVLRSKGDLVRVNALAQSMGSLVQRTEIVEESNELRLVSQNPYKLAYDLSSLLSQEQVEVESTSVREPSLEQVMVRLLGEDAAGGKRAVQ
ncbi:MAG TPA: ABC transporter ATP-binding protein [Nitrososphaerales archaeon]|nr:ABC transporter ATP-binding protein [Nitrososphaerales archaeon]